MGTSIGSKLLLVHSETSTDRLEELFEDSEEDLSIADILEELELDSASPYYDSDSTEWSIGVELESPSYEDLLDQESPWWDKLNQAGDKLHNLFGDGDISLGSFQDVY